MQQQDHSLQYLAIILPERRSSGELYPLTKNYPLSLLPIGCKKLIIYQLESLARVRQLKKIMIVINEESLLIQEYISKKFLIEHPHFQKQIQFFRVEEEEDINKRSQFATFQNLIGGSHTNYKGCGLHTNYKGYIVVMGDMLTNFNIDQLVSFHEEKDADFSLMMKSKKEYQGESQKKISEGEAEIDLDYIVLGDNNQLLLIDSLEILETNGVKLSPSLYKKCKRCVIKKVVDSKIYIISPHLTEIIKNMDLHEDLHEIKVDLVPLIVSNQTNTEFLKLDRPQSTDHTEKKMIPLKIYAHVIDAESFVRKIGTKKIYEHVNFEALIRGAKQRDFLLPNALSDKMDEKKQYRGIALVAESAVIDQGLKIRRSIISSGCRVGKNVEILNSIVLQNTEIKDGCKINDSIIGSGSTLGELVIMKNCYTSMKYHIADGSKVQSEILICHL